jgi:Fe2+ transport system protein FeoA
MSDTIKLSNLNKNHLFEILNFSDSELENKCLEFGLYIGKIGKMMHKAPFNGPIAIEFNKQLLSMRKVDASKIEVRTIE